MKTTFIFNHRNTLSDEDMNKLRDRLKRQIAEGVLVLDTRTEFCGAVETQDAPVLTASAAPIVSPAGGIAISRRVSTPTTLYELKDAIKSGHGREFIRPFDEFTFKLDTGEAVTAVCGGYVNDTRARFVFKDCLAEPGQMNETATNEGGYYKSKGREHILEDVYPHLPPELREIIEPRPLVEAISGETVGYADPLWLPSGTDVFGARDWWEVEPDSVQLEIFKRERDRVKEREGYGTTPYWLRSPFASNSYNFVCVYTDGTVYNTNAYLSLGFAPGFDL